MRASFHPRFRRILVAVAVVMVFAPSTVLIGTASAAPPSTANCGATSTGVTPLIDSVGLYDTGNTIPASHAAVAPDIAPIDGVIGVAALGMSNAEREFDAFIEVTSRMSGVNPQVLLANGAVGGKTMSEWADPNDVAWGVSVSRIGDAGMSPDQVQVVWMKMGSQLGDLNGSVDERVEQERGWLEATIENARAVFPNLERVYMSSRIYAGYNVAPTHNEPETGYDNGLSVRAVASDSLAGATAVWTAWGPYLWADGTIPRSDGLTWECSDFQSDGVHPSATGEQKVADLLTTFFTTDTTACGWFLAAGDGCGSDLVPPCGGGGCEGSARFVDVPKSNIFFADIEWLADAGITAGCNPPENDRFCPDAEVTRGQMAAFLDRALALQAGPDVFTDTDGSVFVANINALALAGITKGCNPPENDRFCVDASVSRGQMAAFLTRAFGLTLGEIDTFLDDDTSIFENDIEALALAGITKGCNPPVNDRYCPTASVSRAQMAAFLHRAAPLIAP